MEPITVVGTGLAILGSKEILTKLLGPTADYLGEEVRNVVAKCNVNLDNIFRKATTKLGDRIDQPGTVSPRVLKHVFDEGRFCEDELTAEYYGGILASSRSGNGRDDRGVTLLAVIKDLSVYQLRFHYLVYLIISRMFKGEELNLADRTDCDQKMQVFIPMKVFHKAMDFTATEDPDAILTHVLFGLGKHDLITNFSSGPSEFLRQHLYNIPEDGIMLSPTLLGAELFLWSVGLSGASGTELFQTEITVSIEGIVIEDGSMPIMEVRKLAPPKADG